MEPRATIIAWFDADTKRSKFDCYKCGGEYLSETEAKELTKLFWQRIREIRVKNAADSVF